MHIEKCRKCGSDNQMLGECKDGLAIICMRCFSKTGDHQNIFDAINEWNEMNKVKNEADA